MPRPHWLFVTGKLAEPSLRRMLAAIAATSDFDFSVAVLPITVAALATTRWIADHLQVPAGIDRVLLPGLCPGDPDLVAARARVPVERGPEDLRDLPEYFGRTESRPKLSGDFDIEILAEINHVARLDLKQILDHARHFRAQGADVIDLGCHPGDPWSGANETVRALRDQGLRVSIDSFTPADVEAAVRAGAELVLSVNSTNRELARDWGVEVVAIPDVPSKLETLEDTVDKLAAWKVPFRIDPVLEPIGFGFAASLGRYLEARRLFPHCHILMGVGNLTELSDADSAAINVLLLGFCAELGIRSVLTTEVINWCRSAVRELDLGRRLVYQACRDHVLPKHLAPDLVLLRDPKLREYGDSALKELASRITDPNVRLFAERGRFYALSAALYLESSDPFDLFAQLAKRLPIDPAHAFYLGYELAKASTALTLGKNYVQDQALRWGFLTAPEPPGQPKMTSAGNPP
jgi:dihydropteroate synthase-like protein